MLGLPVRFAFKAGLSGLSARLACQVCLIGLPDRFACRLAGRLTSWACLLGVPARLTSARNAQSKWFWMGQKIVARGRVVHHETGSA